MVLLAKCRQTLAELIRIRIELAVRVDSIEWILAYISVFFFSTDSLAIVVLMKLFWPFSGQPAGDFWPLIADICSKALVFIILIIFYWYAICKDYKKVQGFEIKK